MVGTTMNKWEELSEEELEEEAARMFYRMEGWEKYWLYEKRPEWLRKKYP